MYAVPEDLMAQIPEEFRNAASIRAFAKDHGLQVGARGRFSRSVLEAYAAQFRSIFMPDPDPSEVPF